jgi:hypothetical protein
MERAREARARGALRREARARALAALERPTEARALLERIIAHYDGEMRRALRGSGFHVFQAHRREAVELRDALYPEARGSDSVGAATPPPRGPW